MGASPNNPPVGVDVSDAWLRFKDRLHAFALRRVGSAAEADDVVQDVLLHLHQHRDRIESDRLTPWIFTTARNAVIDRFRKSRGDVVSWSAAADAPGDAPEGSTATATHASSEPVTDAASDDRTMQELATCVRPLLAMLSAEDRAVLEGVELAGASQADLAAEAGAPASTIKSRVQRARQRLREHFERCCAIELDARGNPRDFSSRGSPDYPQCGGCDCGATEK